MTFPRIRTQWPWKRRCSRRRPKSAYFRGRSQKNGFRSPCARYGRSFGRIDLLLVRQDRNRQTPPESRLNWRIYGLTDIRQFVNPSIREFVDYESPFIPRRSASQASLTAPTSMSLLDARRALRKRTSATATSAAPPARNTSRNIVLLSRVAAAACAPGCGC